MPELEKHAEPVGALYLDGELLGIVIAEDLRTAENIGQEPDEELEGGKA